MGGFSGCLSDEVKKVVRIRRGRRSQTGQEPRWELMQPKAGNSGL